MTRASDNVLRVLLVEDRAHWRKILRHHMEKACRGFKNGLEILEAENFNDAWDALEEECPWDLMITDIRLPECDQQLDNRGEDKQGILLLGLAGEKNIPSIVVSGSQVVSANDIRNFFKEYHVRDYFSKNSFDSTRFIQEIETILTNPVVEKTVFIGYSRNHRSYLDRLQVHLKPLERSARVRLFDDTKINAGEDWKAAIFMAIDAAKAAVLLLGADFLASDFIQDEELPRLLKAAREGNLKLLPVIVAPCNLEAFPELYEIQAVNNLEKPVISMSESEREDLWIKVARIVRDNL